MIEQKINFGESLNASPERWYLDGADKAADTYTEVKPKALSAEEALDHAKAQFAEADEVFDDRAAHQYIATVSGHITTVRLRTAEMV